MKIKDLKEIIDKAIQEGKGDYDVVTYANDGRYNYFPKPDFDDEFKEMWLE